MAELVTAASLVSALPASEAAAPRRSGGARTGWTLAGLILAAALVVTAVLSTVTNVAYQKLVPRQRAFTGALAAVSIHVASGSVTVDRTAAPRTVVASSGSRGLQEPTDVERVTGGSLVIRSDCGSVVLSNNCHRNYVVRVSPDVAVTIDTGQGNVVVSAMRGPLALHTGEGDVSVRGDVGTLSATTGQGNVSGADLRAPSVDVQSGQGDVDLGFALPPTRVVASSSQGNVSVVLPRGAASYQVHASSGQGAVSNTVAENSVSRRQIRVDSSQGDVTVRYRPR
jgi:hypothetical protein